MRTTDFRPRPARRRRALDRVSEALERVAEKDGAQPEQEMLDVVAARLAGPFARAGYVDVTGAEVRDHWDIWLRRGTPANPADAVPAAAAAANDAGRAAGAAAAVLAGRPAPSLHVSPCAPWEDGFTVPGGGALVLFQWRGDVGGEIYLGCVAVSPDGAAYLEDVVAAGSVAGQLRDGLLGAVGAGEQDLLASCILRLQEAIAGFNLASALAREPARLGIAFGADPVPSVAVTWDGDTLPEAVAARLPVQPAPGRSPVPEPDAGLVDAVVEIGFAPDSDPCAEPAAAPRMR